MAEWTRNTSWRQGHIVDPAAARALGLIDDSTADGSAVVVISHDCDLTASPDKEPDVEVVIGSTIAKPGADANAKNARRLHLVFSNGPGERCVELTANNKSRVPKSALADFAPCPEHSLDPRGREILQRWLAARYRRAAFPDAFDSLISKTLKKRIGTALEDPGDCIRSVQFDLEETPNQPEGGGPRFSLGIYLVYVSEPDPEDAEERATKAAEAVEAAFEAEFRAETGGWHDIELRYCDAISDNVMTVAVQSQLRQWNLDHVSLEENPPQPMMP